MLKKIILNSLIIFSLSFLLHNFYSYLPSFFSSIIAPVNESIWEHNKMIFSSYMLLLLIEYLFYKHKNNNYVTANVVASLFNIVIFLLIYIPIYKLFGEHLLTTLIIYFITILISSYIKFLIEKRKNNKKLNLILGFSIIVIYSIFLVFTYYPLKIELFYDTQNKMYSFYKFIT